MKCSRFFSGSLQKVRDLHNVDTKIMLLNKARPRKEMRENIFQILFMLPKFCKWCEGDRPAERGPACGRRRARAARRRPSTTGPPRPEPRRPAVLCRLRKMHFRIEKVANKYLLIFLNCGGFVLGCIEAACCNKKQIHASISENNYHTMKLELDN